MIPAFDIEGGLPLALSRAVSVSGLVAAAGSLFYAWAVAPAGLDGATQAMLRRVCAWSLAASLGGAVLWLAAETRDMAGDLQPDAVWAVLGTLFGRLLLARLALLALAAAALAARFAGLAAGLGCAALVLQAGHSHALAMGGSPALLASSTLHILAAGLWLGGLPALLAVVASGPAVIARTAAERFSWLGIACVAALLATASFQAWVLVASLPGLVGTAYGWMVGVKATLFAGLLGLAARNRRRLTPALPAPDARRGLAWAIGLELALGLAVLASAGVLTELQPAMHTQAVWPFAWMPSLSAAREDPDIAREVALAGGALCLGLVLVALAWVQARRRPWLAGAFGMAAFATGALALPHVSPLLVPAVPTQYFHSPTGFSAASIVQGAAIYPGQCASCHGAGGHGDGPLARTRAVPPADLTAAHLWMHDDGQLFWWLTHGMEAPRGGLAMPGFPNLSDDEIWALIDFIRARNAGLTLGTGGWATPLTAPDFSLACEDGSRPLSALRGRVVRIALAPRVTVQPVGPGPGRGCHTDDPAAAQAYAIAAPGAGSVLVDANGWLRAAAPGSVPPEATLAARPLPSARPAMDMPGDMKM